ncbi:MAG TPA: prepilin-type N-terminal cleavage/methylation domain-containing protein [Planctomycetota bacterium]|nr:prepilin-type N-terminal cleavage/methylation domain-containing protein [Planctomycetota bacterium]
MRASPRRGRRGFTLMEILISMTILMIGLLPMLAVFKTALNNLNRSIEDTYASAIAQSVLDSIRLGIHEMRVDHGPQAKFFIFEHDGIAAAKRADAETASPDGRTQLEIDRAGMLKDQDISKADFAARVMARDYCIVLPSDKDPAEAPPPGYGGSRPPQKAFLYPRKSPGDNAARTGVQYVLTGKVGGVQGRKIKVERVYWLGQKLRASRQDIESTDTLTQYGFAFTMRVAKAPDPLAPKQFAKDQDPLASLYEVCVMVFRNFNADPNSPRNDVVGGPGREFISYVSE